MINFKIVILLFTLAYTTARDIEFENCLNDPNTSRQYRCNVHNVNVEPCPSLCSNNYCNVKKSSIIHITMEYTPNFLGKMTGNIYHRLGRKELPMTLATTISGNTWYGTFSTNQRGIRVNSTIIWPIPNKFSEGESTFKIKLWNEELQECCANIKLHIQEQN